jgi:anti-anti-sigma regulatory factor
VGIPEVAILTPGLASCIELSSDIQHFLQDGSSRIPPEISGPPMVDPLIWHKSKLQVNGIALALVVGQRMLGEVMLGVHIEKIGDLAIVECEGRVVRSEAAFQLRQAMTSQRDARIIVLDLSEVSTIDGGGLGMLVFLCRWTYENDIRLKLFNPTMSVRDRLERANSIPDFDIATRDEVVALLAWAASQTRAA